MGGKNERQGLSLVRPADTMEIHPLPRPKGKPEINDKHFKTIRPRRNSLGQATFGIYGDPGR